MIITIIIVTVIITVTIVIAMTKILINNGNWANWGAVWPDFKIDQACRGEFEVKYDFRPKLHNTKFNNHCNTSIL